MTIRANVAHVQFTTDEEDSRNEYGEQICSISVPVRVHTGKTTSSTCQGRDGKMVYSLEREHFSNTKEKVESYSSQKMVRDSTQ